MDAGSRTGKRLLLAMMSQNVEEDDGGRFFSPEEFSIQGVLLCIASLVTLISVLALCACKDGDSEEKNHANGKSRNENEDSNMQIKPDTSPQASEAVDNGGTASNRNSVNMSKHSRQASSASGNNIRPTSLRELPEPPVDSHHHPPHHHHHSRNTSASGVVVLPQPPPPPPPPPPTTSSVPANGSGGGVGNGLPTAANSADHDDEYALPTSLAQRLAENGSSPAARASNEVARNTHGDPDSNGYDHFGPKKIETPPGYDQLGNVMIRRKSNDGGVNEGGAGGGQEMTTQTSKVTDEGGGVMDGKPHHHYAQPKERMYDVVKDVKTDSRHLYHSDSFSQVKEEDPYNQIGDSDSTISNAVIKRIRQSIDPDDLYATIQGDSDGSLATVAAQQASLSKQQQLLPNNNNNNKSTSSSGTTPSSTSFIPSSTSSSSLHKNGEGDEGEDEYAVVQKPSASLSAHGTPTRNRPQRNDNYDNSISPYNTYRPPEPPRMYDHYAENTSIIASGRINDGDDNDLYEDDDLQPGGTKEHMYSKVSARESLASMSARYALNPYEVVPDLPENTYATVEGGSGDGVIPEVTMRHRLDRTVMEENRLSQNSDTYAEIGISGGGLTTSVISNTSTTSSNNNNNNSSVILGTSSGSNTSGGAPIPPSLDSLHQMTKSQTSSEGDRLSDRMSDRYPASPDEWMIPGQMDSIGAVGGGGGGSSHHLHHHYHRSAEESEEESYGTLKRTTALGGGGGGGGGMESPSNSNVRGGGGGGGVIVNGRQATVTDVESGEVTPIPFNNNYETVEDDNDSLSAGGGGRRFVFRARGDGEIRGGGNILDSEENDPNYESVDETRAKVALLKARESNGTTLSSSSPSSSAPPTAHHTYATPHEFRNAEWRKNANFNPNSNSTSKSDIGSPSLSSSYSSPPLPTPHVSVVNIFRKDSKDETTVNLSSSSSSTMSSPVIDVDAARSHHRRIRKPNHDYEEVDLSPPSSPQHQNPPQLQQQQQQELHQRLSTSAPAHGVVESSVDSDIVRNRVFDSHTYEELPNVKLSKKDEKRKSDRESKKKLQSSLSSSSEEKKKLKEEKKKSKLEEKDKKKGLAVGGSGSGEGSGSNGNGASWDGSKKSDSWETNRTRL